MTRKELKSYQYWSYLRLKLENAETQFTVEQIDDLYTAFVSGVIGNLGSGKILMRIDELSPLPLAKDEKELQERYFTIETALICHLAELHPKEEFHKMFSEEQKDKFVEEAFKIPALDETGLFRIRQAHSNKQEQKYKQK